MSSDKSATLYFTVSYTPIFSEQFKQTFRDLNPLVLSYAHLDKLCSFVRVYKDIMLKDSCSNT